MDRIQEKFLLTQNELKEERKRIEAANAELERRAERINYLGLFPWSSKLYSVVKLNFSHAKLISEQTVKEVQGEVGDFRRALEESEKRNKESATRLEVLCGKVSPHQLLSTLILLP